MNIQDKMERVGGLSKPSKMPGYGWSIPASKCKVGSTLAQIKGTVCNKCYALKGHYPFPNVQTAMQRRLDRYHMGPRTWQNNMIDLLNSIKNPHFRWFDSGDLQSIAMFKRIVAVAEGTPGVKHWLPTREYNIVQDFLKAGGVIPENLTVRLSAHMIDGPPPWPTMGSGVLVSTVHTDITKYPQAFPCPARTQNNNCGNCRSCWDKSVAWVSYPAH